MVGVADGSELHRGDVLEAQHGAVVVGSDDDVLELGNLLQSALVLQGVLEDVLHAQAVVAVDGLLAELSGGGLEVLFGQGCRDVFRHDAILRHHVGFHPDAHRIGAAQLHDVAHALQALHLRDDVDVEVVRDEVLVVLSVGAGQGVDLQEGRLALHGLYAHSRDLGGQQALCPRHAVLHVDGCHVGVGALLEVDVDGGGAGVGGQKRRRAETQQPFLRQRGHHRRQRKRRGDDGVHDGIGAGTGVGRVDADGWRRDVGVRLQGQGEVADGAHEDYHDGDGHCHHRALYEYVTFHFL